MEEILSNSFFLLPTLNSFAQTLNISLKNPFFLSISIFITLSQVLILFLVYGGELQSGISASFLTT